MPLASLTRRLLRPRMDGLIGRAPSSGITTAQLAEAAPAHLICRTRRSENRELDLYTPKSARKASSREPYTDFALDRLARDEHGPGAKGSRGDSPDIESR